MDGGKKCVFDIFVPAHPLALTFCTRCGEKKILLKRWAGRGGRGERRKQRLFHLLHVAGFLIGEARLLTSCHPVSEQRVRNTSFIAQQTLQDKTHTHTHTWHCQTSRSSLYIKQWGSKKTNYTWNFFLFYEINESVKFYFVSCCLFGQ